MIARTFVSIVCIIGAVVPAIADPLIVVQDRGGASALPYYQSLKLPPVGSNHDSHSPPSQSTVSAPPTLPQRFTEADMLPVRSEHLTPGVETTRRITAPGITPLFIVGDDAQSRRWLLQRSRGLRELRAIGLVTHVENAQALEVLRRLVPELTLIPASADDVAERLGISHYPVLITANTVEQ